MKIAFTSEGKTWESKIDPRFGRAEYILVYDQEKDSLSVIDNTEVKNQAHGAGPSTAQKLFEIKPDVLITGNGPGNNAAMVLKKLNLKLFVNAHNFTVKEAYENYKNNSLEEMPF